MPKQFKLNGFNLGQWVSVQRIAKDSMSPDRKQRLDDLGFIWDPFAAAWEEGFSKLLQFKRMEGDLKVAASFKLDGYNLGKWVSKQRTTKESMSPERRQRLDDIGFVWDTLAEAWEVGFTKLRKFKAAEGHVNVPATYKIDGYNLGNWCRTQRKKKNSLSPERKQSLDEMDFIWDARKDKP